MNSATVMSSLGRLDILWVLGTFSYSFLRYPLSFLRVLRKFCWVLVICNQVVMGLCSMFLKDSIGMPMFFCRHGRKVVRYV